MTLLLTLAQETITNKTWWNPYMKGVLVVVMAVALFVGSAYLLLYTDVGSRLGFLITAGAFTGFIAVHSLFWITGQFPNGPLGRSPGWPVKAVVKTPTASNIAAVKNIQTTGHEADSGAAGQIKAALDTELTNQDGKFDLFTKPDQYLAQKTLIKGGGRKWPIWWSEKATWAAVEICPTLEQQPLPLEAPPTPKCDSSKPTQWVVVEKDLGNLRLPSWLFFVGSSSLFGLILYSLNAYERDQRAAKEAEEAAAAAAASGDGSSGDGSNEPATT